MRVGVGRVVMMGWVVGVSGDVGTAVEVAVGGCRVEVGAEGTAAVGVLAP